MTTTALTSERERAELDAAVGAVFGAHAALAHAYAGLLSTDGIIRGVIGPGEADRIWSRHLFNSAALAGLIPLRARVIDLGSGAGLPGIPLALARPDLDLVLLEPMSRRASFLRDALTELGLGGVEVVVGRAEPGVTTPADVVVARAVAPLEKLIGLAEPLLADRGTLLAMKGNRAAEEIAALPAALAARSALLSVPAVGGPVAVVRVVRGAGRAGKGRR